MNRMTRAALQEDERQNMLMRVQRGRYASRMYSDSTTADPYAWTKYDWTRRHPKSRVSTLLGFSFMAAYLSVAAILMIVFIGF